MKLTLNYTAPFTIPATLPHAPYEGGDDCNICRDTFTVSPAFPSTFALGVPTVATVIIASLCGTTTLDCVAALAADGSVKVSARSGDAGPEATFDGAENALNAVWGIDFPSFAVVGEVESSYGRFPTMAAYQAAKRAVKTCQSIAA